MARRLKSIGDVEEEGKSFIMLRTNVSHYNSAAKNLIKLNNIDIIIIIIIIIIHF